MKTDIQNIHILVEIDRRLHQVYLTEEEKEAIGWFLKVSKDIAKPLQISEDSLETITTE